MIEADFQREYRLDMREELPRLSWRRFLVLLQGLSAESRLFDKMRTDNGNGEVITDPELAERAADRFFA